MEQTELQRAIEAILFAAGEPVRFPALPLRWNATRRMWQMRRMR